MPSPAPPGNAIQAFGNGTDVNLTPRTRLVPVTVPPKTEKSPSTDDINYSNTMYDTSIITTCTSIQVGAQPSPCCKLGVLVRSWAALDLQKVLFLLAQLGASHEHAAWLTRGVGTQVPGRIWPPWSCSRWSCSGAVPAEHHFRGCSQHRAVGGCAQSWGSIASACSTCRQQCHPWAASN